MTSARGSGPWPHGSRRTFGAPHMRISSHQTRPHPQGASPSGDSSRRIWRAKSASTLQELPDRFSNLLRVGFQRKVAGVEEADHRMRNVALERLRAGRKEERIVLAPDREERRLVGAEVILEGRIERDIALVIAEQVELDVVGARTRQIEIVERVAVRRYGCLV